MNLIGFATTSAKTFLANHLPGKHDQKTHGRTRSASFVGGKLAASDGEPLPAHIAKLKVPPAWTEIEYSTDPDADLLLTGRDVKGRRQSIYSEAHTKRQAAAKFARTKELEAKYASISKQNSLNIKDPKKKEAASALALIMTTGIRPGSDQDTGARKKAYGATTLLGKHVTVGPKGEVVLKFTGKSGKDLSIPVKDKGVAAMIKTRAASAGTDGRLFNVSQASLSNYTKTLDGGSFKTKDFRTRLGTKTATAAVKALGVPKTKVEYKKMVSDVAVKVSKVLGNTPVVALQSYISPSVFQPWRVANGF